MSCLACFIKLMACWNCLHIFILLFFAWHCYTLSLLAVESASARSSLDNRNLITHFTAWRSNDADAWCGKAMRVRVMHKGFCMYGWPENSSDPKKQSSKVHCARFAEWLSLTPDWCDGTSRIPSFALLCDGEIQWCNWIKNNNSILEIWSQPSHDDGEW